MTRRPTLRALAASRGMTCAVWRPASRGDPWQADAAGWDGGGLIARMIAGELRKGSAK